MQVTIDSMEQMQRITLELVEVSREMAMSDDEAAPLDRDLDRPLVGEGAAPGAVV